MVKPRYTVANLEPGNSIGFLIKRCGVLMTQIAERRFESTAVSFTQWTALMRLCACAEPMSATQLSRELGHDMGALTRVVDELERRGLVRRERSRRDRRAVEILVTPAGRREAESTRRVIVELLNELVEPFTDAEFHALFGLLQRMLVHLQSAASRSPVPDASVRTATTRRRGRKSGGRA